MRYLLAFVLAAFLAAPAYAAFQGPGAGQGAMGQGGFSGTAAAGTATTIAQAKSLPDDARVTLTGNIISQLPYDDDKYMFRDSTGEIVVEIDHKDFRGQNVTPANTVRIYGEVEKDFGKPVEIDVKGLEVLK